MMKPTAIQPTERSTLSHARRRRTTIATAALTATAISSLRLNGTLLRRSSPVFIRNSQLRAVSVDANDDNTARDGGCLHQHSVPGKPRRHKDTKKHKGMTHVDA